MQHAAAAPRGAQIARDDLHAPASHPASSSGRLSNPGIKSTRADRYFLAPNHKPILNAGPGKVKTAMRVIAEHTETSFYIGTSI